MGLQQPTWRSLSVRILLPEFLKGALYPISVFEFLNVNKLSMKRVVLEEALTAVASKLPRNKKLEMVGEEGFEPPTNGV